RRMRHGVVYLAGGNEDLLHRPVWRRAHIPGFARLADLLMSDQIAQIRNDPVFAGFDEPVFVKLVDIALDHIDLFSDDPEKRAQRITSVGVALAMHRRQELVQTVWILHGRISWRMSVAGTSRDRTTSCAGKIERSAEGRAHSAATG